MSKSVRTYIIVSISIILYILVGYFTVRTQFLQFISIYSILFVGFYLLYLNNKNNPDFKLMTGISILFRIVILFCIPNLSNDFYRFIWDGRLTLLGFNPFLHLPKDIVQTEVFTQLGKDATELYNGQGSLSPGNYTCYPPLNQFFFILSALILPESILGSIVILRVFIILADLGTIYYGRKILKHLGLPESNILFFALNPFIIIELTGNLHFEGIMIFFLVVAIYYLLQNKLLKSAILLSLSISVKLIPYIFIPVLLRRLGQRWTVKYFFIVLLLSVILFIPYFSPGLIENFATSIDLYFRKFEFNASIYYIIRWIGYETFGWNIIQKAGPLLGLMVFTIVMLISIIRRNEYPKQLMVSMLFTVSIYYFLSTTVHPWYIAIPLILSVFTSYRFVVVWSFMIMLTYFAYSSESFQENFWLIAIEYTVVYGFMIYELLKKRKFIHTPA